MRKSILSGYVTFSLLISVVFIALNLNSYCQFDDCDSIYYNTYLDPGPNDSVYVINFRKWKERLPDCASYRNITLSEYDKIPKDKRQFVKYLSSPNLINIKKDTFNLSDDILDFTNLEVLYLQNTHLIELSEYFFKLQNLRAITLTDVTYTGKNSNNFFQGVENFKNIRFLQLSDIDGVKTLSDKILELSSLEHLAIKGNYASSLPDSFSKLRKLKYIELDSLVNTEMPTTLSNSCEMDLMDIKGNGITKIPDYFSDFEKLVVLNISSENINSLDKNLGKFPKLSALSLKNTKITNINSLITNITTAKVERLEIFNLSNNKIKFIPADFNKIKDIIDCDFSGNEIEYIEGSFENNAIGGLDLSGNKLTVIPNIFQKGIVIGELILKNNMIKELPSWIGEAKISEINLANNSIKYFGVELCKKKDLKQIILDDNPIEDFDPKICECSKKMLVSIIGASEQLAEKIRKYNDLETDKVKIVTTKKEFDKYRYNPLANKPNYWKD